MSSRRTFLAAGAAAAAAGLAGFADGAPETAAAAAPKGPSDIALAQAKWLQKTFPKAQLSDELVTKIAGDIDSNASIAADYRKATLDNWNEPDFVFAAGPKESSSS